jgi:hypothetical protein
LDLLPYLLLPTFFYHFYSLPPHRTNNLEPSRAFRFRDGPSSSKRRRLASSPSSRGQSASTYPLPPFSRLMSSLPSSPSSISSAPVTASAALSAPDPAGYGRADPSLRRSDTGTRSDSHPGRTSSTASDRKRRFAHPEGDRSRHHASGTMESRGHARGSSSRAPSLPRAVRGDPAAGSSYDAPIDLSSSPGPPRRTSRHGQPPQGDGGDYMECFQPRWQPDSEVADCPICGTPFSFFYRKHHCRKCGRVVCASCSPHRITIPRQFIVRPPDFGNSPSQMVPPHAAHAAHPGGPPASSPTAFNPALGGGEEVRLCNPCVPDPNPDPPRGYMMPPRHRSHHSMSTATGRQSPYGVFVSSLECL